MEDDTVIVLTYVPKFTEIGELVFSSNVHTLVLSKSLADAADDGYLFLVPPNVPFHSSHERNLSKENSDFLEFHSLEYSMYLLQHVDITLAMEGSSRNHDRKLVLNREQSHPELDEQLKGYGPKANLVLDVDVAADCLDNPQSVVQAVLDTLDAVIL